MMKSLKNILLFFFTFLTSLSFAQDNSLDATYYKAVDASDQHFYRKALSIYRDILKAKPDDSNVYFQMGKCYLSLNYKDSAIYFFEKAILNIDQESKENSYKSSKAPAISLFFLGKTYHLANKFEKSNTTLTRFSTDFPDIAKTYKTEIKRIKFYNQNGAILVQHPIKIEITNLGRNINTVYNEHSPTISADESELIFTSRRQGTQESKLLPDGQYDENLYYSQQEKEEQWSPATYIKAPINTTVHDASIALSADGQTMLLYRDDDGNGNLYITSKLGNEWAIPQKLDNNINSKFKETQATITSDKQTIYFTSNRPGGYGGLDIYKSKLLPNGIWSIPENLGKTINSEYDEESPFMHPDGVTLFFSSRGHNTMGGYDIFFSTLDKENDTWSEPMNIGYPINSSSDDLYYVPTTDGKKAYLTSERFGSIGRADIFKVSLSEEQEKPLIVMKGTVHTTDGDVPKNMVINVNDKSTGKLVGQYRPNSSTGKFLFILTPGKYHAAFMADEFLYFDKDFDIPKGSAYQLINKPIVLSPILLNNLKYLTFNVNDDIITPELERYLNKLAEYLKEKTTYIVNIYPQNNEDQALNDKRVDKVRDFMETNGIIKKRIKFLDKNKWDVNLVIISEGNNQLVVENNTKNQDNNIETETTIPKNNNVTVHCLLFGFDKFETKFNNNEISKLANFLISTSDVILTIYGYTDVQGDEGYNKTLSLQRALFVKNTLIAKGVPAKQISVIGKGEENQIAIDLNPESRKYNRRVEFALSKKRTTSLTILPVEVPIEYKIK